MKKVLKILAVPAMVLAVLVFLGVGMMAMGYPVFEKIQELKGDPKMVAILVGGVILAIAVPVFFLMGLARLWALVGRVRAARRAAREEEAPVVEESPPKPLEVQDIVSYFLGLFRQQKGVVKDAPSNMVPLGSGYGKKERIWELSVKSKGQFEKRRMTISRIGDASASKSTCYYVIYNAHMVLKIPPQPITDFDKYIQDIRNEWAIADLLAPRECLVPGISVILKQVRPMPGKKGLSPKEQEDAFIFWARGNTDVHEYLKINGSFVLFMDLANYMFLSRVMDELHDVGGRAANEIAGYPEVLTNSQVFEGRYGTECSAECANLQKAYSDSLSHIKEILARETGSASPFIHKIGKWFMFHVAQKSLDKDETGLQPAAHRALNQALKQSMQDNKGPVAAYRQAIYRHMENLAFTQNRPKMAGICANLLDLLFWMGAKKVAMRDLKPDNLLVAGNPDDYPGFLLRPHDYQIGLIDVETAVDFDTLQGKKVAQPMLAGTPVYATPTHMMPNELIQVTLGNLEEVLHLQDWYAMVGMLYEVATGSRLFRGTAKKLPEVMGHISAGVRGGEDPCQAVADGSRLFWKSAVAEFEARVSENEKILSAISVPLFESVLPDLKKVISRNREFLAMELANRVKAQNLYTDKKRRQFLLSASVSKIRELAAKLEAETGEGAPRDKVLALALLRRLASIKGLLESHGDILADIDENRPSAKLDDLLRVMFHHVRSFMFLKDWEDPSGGI